MYKVTERFKELCERDTTRKEYYITFPNGDHDPIYEGQMVANTFERTESLCTSSEMRVGLMESSSCEFDAVGLDKTVTGKTIKAWIRIYDDENEEWLECPQGEYIIYSATKTDGAIRHVTAYDRLRNKSNMALSNSFENYKMSWRWAGAKPYTPSAKLLYLSAFGYDDLRDKFEAHGVKTRSAASEYSIGSGRLRRRDNWIPYNGIRVCSLDVIFYWTTGGKTPNNLVPLPQSLFKVDGVPKVTHTDVADRFVGDAVDIGMKREDALRCITPHFVLQRPMGVIYDTGDTGATIANDKEPTSASSSYLPVSKEYLDANVIYPYMNMQESAFEQSGVFFLRIPYYAVIGDTQYIFTDYRQSILPSVTVTELRQMYVADTYDFNISIKKKLAVDATDKDFESDDDTQTEYERNRAHYESQYVVENIPNMVSLVPAIFGLNPKYGHIGNDGALKEIPLRKSSDPPDIYFSQTPKRGLRIPCMVGDVLERDETMYITNDYGDYKTREYGFVVMRYNRATDAEEDAKEAKITKRVSHSSKLEYIVDDNYILDSCTLYDVDADKIATNIANNLKGVSYTESEVQTKIHPWIEVGDVVETEDGNRFFIMEKTVDDLLEVISAKSSVDVEERGEDYTDEDTGEEVAIAYMISEVNIDEL